MIRRATLPGRGSVLARAIGGPTPTLALLALGAVPTVAQVPAIETTVVTQEGLAVPGVGNVTRVDNVAVNGAGETRVEVDTDFADTDQDTVLLGPTGVVLREGQALGRPAGALLDSFDSVTLTDAGDSSYNLFLDGTAGTSDDSGIYLNSTLLIQESDIATAMGFSPGTPFIGFFDTKINESNEILVLGTADDPNVSSTVDQFLLTVNGAQSLFLKEGDAVPGVAGVSVSSFATGTHGTDFNESGDILYFVDSDAPTSEDGFVMLGSTVLAREGQPSPVPGRNWSSLSSPELSLNDDGDHVFSGSLDGDTSTNSVIVRNGEVFQQEGDTVTGLSGFALTSFSSAPILIANRGEPAAEPEVLWYGDWDDPDTDVDTGVFLDDVLVLQEGVSTVGGIAIDSFASFTDGFARSDDGRYALFDVTLEGSIDTALLLDFGPWKKLGLGLAGNVEPRLRGFGQAVPGAPTTLRVTGGVPGGTAVVVFGLARVDMPFLGGTLVPSPDRVFFNVPLGPEGELDFPFTWPAFPPGTKAYFQVWVADPGAPGGFSATNGVEVCAP